MKKTISALLAAAMILTAAGCGDNTSSASGSTNTATAEANTSGTTSDSSEAPETSKPLSNPVALDEDGNIDMAKALAYETDIEALKASLAAKEVDPNDTVSANSNEKTTAVFEYLRSIYGKQILTCQQMMDSDSYEDIVYYNATGDMPAMKGFDFIFCTGSYINHEMIDEAIRWHDESGGLVTFTWHWNVPIDVDDPSKGYAFYQDEIQNWDQVNAVTPGTKEYEQVIHDIDTIAMHLQRLEEAGVTVMFRPLHEASGSWFWWGLQGKKSAENEVFQKLWYMIFDRIENYHKLTNIIWIWNGQSQFCTVSANTYDIAGVDYYASTEDHSALNGQYKHLDGLSAEDEGKMLALTECGYLPDPADCVATDTMWLYYMIWNGDFVFEANASGKAKTSLDGTPSPNTERMTNEMLVEYYAHEALLTYKDLPAQFTEGKGFPQRIKNWEYFKMS